MTVARLTETQRAYVVTRLAQYASPATVAAEVYGRFGVTVHPSAIRHYDATSQLAERQRLAPPRWRILFDEARRAYTKRPARPVFTEAIDLATLPPAGTSERESDIEAARAIIQDAHDALGRILDRWPT